MQTTSTAFHFERNIRCYWQMRRWMIHIFKLSVHLRGTQPISWPLLETNSWWCTQVFSKRLQNQKFKYPAWISSASATWSILSTRSRNYEGTGSYLKHPITSFHVFLVLTVVICSTPIVFRSWPTGLNERSRTGTSPTVKCTCDIHPCPQDCHRHAPKLSVPVEVQSIPGFWERRPSPWPEFSHAVGIQSAVEVPFLFDGNV